MTCLTERSMTSVDGTGVTHPFCNSPELGQFEPVVGCWRRLAPPRWAAPPCVMKGLISHVQHSFIGSSACDACDACWYNLGLLWLQLSRADDADVHDEDTTYLKTALLRWLH